MQYFEEALFCSIEEYREGQVERVRPSEIEVDELYLLMMAVRRPRINEPEALRIPVYPLDTRAQQHGGLYLVRYELLDSDLDVTTEKADVFSEDGYIARLPRFFGGGYLKSYTDGITDEDLHSLTESNNVVST